MKKLKPAERSRGEGIMRKGLIAVLIFVFAVFFAYSHAEAISGACSNCHTMHNSQNGSDVDGSGPNDRLLNASCVACHSGSTGQKNGTTNAPIVLHTSAPSGQGAGKTLAGGDFYWVATGYGATDSKGHNVTGVAAEDGDIGVVPPGWDQAATTGVTFDSKTLEVTGGAGWTGNRLTCAGTFGCHGTRDDTDFGGIQGAHHGNSSSEQASSPTTVANSYRFLANIKGLENGDWNWSETATTHNEYFGADDNTNYTNKNTISYFCGECHGVYHKTIGRSSSPWTRHPTDIVLPSSSEYDDYNSDDGDDTAGDYSVEAPLARASVPSSSSSTVTPGTDLVMCLSCHRAHGSPQPDLLRWAYSDMTAGGGNTNGCFTCHTDKN